MASDDKIKSFTDIIAWKEGHMLLLEIYRISADFPKEEIYCLTNQVRRAAISVTSNIAEGYSRKTSKEKIQFYYTSLGSLTELQSQLVVARDLKYLNQEKFNSIAQKTVKACKLIHGLIKTASDSQPKA